MDNLQLIEALDEAIRLIKTARVDLAGGSSTIWGIAFDAVTHLEKQIKELLAPPAPEVFTCNGCGRKELACSMNPCDDAIADRAAVL